MIRWLIWKVYEWRYQRTIDSGVSLKCLGCAVHIPGFSGVEAYVPCWYCFAGRFAYES